MNFDADLTACAALVQRADPERFAAAMASPVATRRILFPLYAFNVEVSRAPWVTQEPMIAEMRLQWWRNALEEIATGGPVRRHEVVTPLSAFLDPDSAKMLDKLIVARRWDIYRDAFDDAAHFHSYLSDTAGVLMSVAVRALDYDARTRAEDHIRALGYATGLARFFQAVPALEGHGRIPLVDGRWQAIAGLAKAALQACAPRRQLRRSLGPMARHAVTEAYLTHAILQQATDHPQRVAEGSLTVNPLRRSLLLWQWA